MKRFGQFLAVFVVLGLAGCGGGSDSSEALIRFSSDVDESYRLALVESISSLEEYHIEKPTDDLLKIMQLQDASPASLQSWLADRVKYVVSSNFDWSASIFESDSHYDYPYPDSLPVLEEPEESEESGPPTENSDVVTLMWNMGMALYLTGKTEGILLGVSIPGYGELNVTTPRIGLLQAGNVVPDFGSRHIDRIFTISTLFHEGRHSDGSRESLGFPHAICPTGHDYAGHLACDRSANGPYAIDAEILKNLTNACDQCSQSEKEVLRLIYADLKDRILVDDSVIWNDRPEGVE